MTGGRKFGQVYMIAFDTPSGETYVKVGYAEDPAIRLKSLQVACPFPLYLIGAVAATPAVEKDFHRVLSDVHIRGEWYGGLTEIIDVLSAARDAAVAA